MLIIHYFRTKNNILPKIALGFFLYIRSMCEIVTRGDDFILPLIIGSISTEDKKDFYTSLYRTYYPVMAHTAFRVTNGGVNTEDIVQEALVRLLRQYEKLCSMHKSALACYITLTVKAAAIDAPRKKYRNDTWFYYGAEDDFADTASDGSTPEDALFKGEERKDRIRAVQMLPLAQRDLLLYKYVLEMTNSELAHLYNTTETNVRQMLSRARRKLCGLLEELR